MDSTNSRKIGLFAVLALIIVIICGATVIAIKYPRESAVEISLRPAEVLQTRVYVGGAVNNPGFFSLHPGDTIQSLIQAAGGANSTSDLNEIQLYLSGSGNNSQAQMIDINRADAWLLEVLPGIGPTLARRIVDYRQKNGPFNNTDEMLNVPGIGTGIYEKFKTLITVAER